MNVKLISSLIVAGVVAMPLASYADESDNNGSAKVFVQDSVITTKVKTALAASKPDSLIHVHVDTDKDGIVYLSGTAPSQHAIDMAVKTASNVDGVIKVHNDIHLRAD